MKRLALLLILAASPAAAQSATLYGSFTIPLVNDAGATCSQHILSAPQADSVWAVWMIPGISVIDSLYRPRGYNIRFQYTVPGGTYAVTARTVRVVNGQRFASCDTVSYIPAYARVATVGDLHLRWGW